ncbi:MAG: glycosyltransferase family 2 protein [Bryobacteraceae bacterium]|nr:glycosyltransferase family 2 protein [Bryobacteraceae bacterium]
MSLLAAVVVALGSWLMVGKARRAYAALPQLPDDPPLGASVSVIIPARNEERVIERAVSSFRGLDVVVVNDSSSDKTAERAEAAGARVVKAPPLPEGWRGKPHACWVGSRQSTAEWLLFVDADTWYERGFAERLASYGEREGLDAVTAFLRQECVTAAERMLVPYAMTLYFAGVSARNVNDPRHPEALANGQCFLIRRAAYGAVGGHRAVASSVIEDVELARVLKRGGKKLRVVRAEEWGAVRMYDSLGAIWRGFEKNSFRFLQVNPWTGVQVMATSILLTSWLPVLAWLAADGEWARAAAFAVLPWLVLRSPWGPLPIYVFQLIALSGMMKTIFGISTMWKGRRV